MDQKGLEKISVDQKVLGKNEYGQGWVKQFEIKFRIETVIQLEIDYRPVRVRQFKFKYL